VIEGITVRAQINEARCHPMSSSKIESKTFDVFLCHNSEDKSEIRRISDDLTKKGIKPWLDEREIIPGTLWQAALEEQISNIKSVAVFIGRSGIGPWQSMEIKASIDQFVKRNCPVIPVFLSSLQGIPEIPILLQNFHSVDFRKLNPEPLQQLIVGITSEKNQVSRLFDDPQNDNIAALSKQIDLRTYHPLTETPPKEQLSQLLILRDRVKEFWIDGILKQSLHHEVLISLGKELKDKAVETPLHRII